MAKLKYVVDGNGVKFYPITIANGVVYIKEDGTQVKLSEYLKSESEADTAALAKKADKVASATSGNFAGLDANGNLTDSGSKKADFATAAQGAKADTAVQPATLSSEISLAKSALVGTDKDTKAEDTIKGAKAYTDDAVSNAIAGLAGALKYAGTVDATHALPSTATKGDVYVVKASGIYAGMAMEVGDYLIYNGSSWDGLNGENQVSNDNTELVIGTSVKVATVDGTEILVKQVEDTTKLECVDCSDTTDYADVSALFK